MMEPVINTTTGAMNPSAIQELLENNSTMPDIRRVIYSIKTETPVRDADGKKLKNEDGTTKMTPLANPILATTIEFIDNTRTTVKNSINDKVDVVEVSLDKNGDITTIPENAVKTVKTASSQSKELGVVYAIWKRLTGTVDERGTVTGDGAGRILNEIVNNAYDTPVEVAKSTLKKNASKEAHAARQAAAKEAADKNPSLAKTVALLSERVQQMGEILTAIQKALPATPAA